MAVVIINNHEPEHEAAARLIELAEEKGHDPSVVEAQRGEHDAALSFRVPDDVAKAFEADRGDRWPSTAAEGDEPDLSATLPGDAYAVDNINRAHAARVENATTEDDKQQSTPTERTSRPGKAQTK